MNHAAWRMMIAPALLLAGCGDGSAPAPVPANDTSATGGANFQAEVVALDDDRRNLVMIRAIRDAGLNCQGVTASRRMEGEGLAYLATCEGGARFLVSIGADGNAQVVTGSDVE